MKGIYNMPKEMIEEIVKEFLNIIYDISNWEEDFLKREVKKAVDKIEASDELLRLLDEAYKNRV